ncbi:6-phospho-beta-glucosidase [Shouchella shacheensis]|uniref:6-phospho-beta-glucosidase n=1 Tax=Shouchella shacheensis TaxID=1649580 RepID=UPI00074037ED|nr:6-phospho-beta-glucosidase [Shouchella shacheensis]
MSLKVVIIGGGSSYTPEIIEGLMARHPQFPVEEIALVDIEAGEAKLRIIEGLAKRMIAKSGLPISLTATLDRRDALKGATYVTTQIRVGGLDAREKDERIPLSHGVLGQETNGPGGVFKAFRTIPVLLEIAEDISEICPDAWLINFTNPAGMVTEALLKHSKHQKVIGVCNIPFNMRTGISEVLHCQVEDVEIEFIGLNHFVFGRRVYVRGEERTAEVLENLMSDSTSYSPANIVSTGWSKAFLQSLRLLPSPYHQYYFKAQEMLEKSLEEYASGGTRAEVVKQVEKDLFEKYKMETLEEKPEELEKRGGAFYSDAACNIMNSMHNNLGDIQTVNVQNNGAIVDLPPEAVIEVNARMTRTGPKAMVVGKLPLPVKGAIQQMKGFEELVIEAAVSGDKAVAYQALVMNPLVSNEEVASVILEEMLEAHRTYLPQFR